jgi:hypothetical protein
LGISLHAIAGSPAPKTMRMMGRLNNQFAVVLIDTGSTNNFVDPDVARRAKLPIQESTTLTVMVANGATIPCRGYCETAQMSLQGSVFNPNLYLLTLGGCDLVLGVEWLRMLGPMLWDFVRLSMDFKWDNQNVHLQGMKPTTNDLEGGEKFRKFHNSECKGILLQIVGTSSHQPSSEQPTENSESNPGIPRSVC